MVLCKKCRWCCSVGPLWDWVCQRPPATATDPNPLDGSFSQVGHDSLCRVERGLYGFFEREGICGPEGLHWEAQI